MNKFLNDNKWTQIEKKKYESVWAYDDYRKDSPGLELAKQCNLLNKTNEVQAKEILDAGCGSGNLMMYLKEQTSDLIISGMDIAHNCLTSQFVDM